MASGSNDCSRIKACCNRFKSHKIKIVKGLRAITEKAITLHPSLNFRASDLICTACRKKVAKLPVDTKEAVATESSSSTSTQDEGLPSTRGTDREIASTSKIPHHDTFVSPNDELVQLNKSLHVLGE